jgi:hypothetical protein
MVLKHHDLRQLNEERIRELGEKDPHALAELSVRLPNDLKELWERVHQNPSNSSRPPSSRLAWSSAETDEEDTESAPEAEADWEEPVAEAGAEPPSARNAEASDKRSAKDCKSNGSAARRKPGRQPGAPRFGRTQKLTVTDWEAHRPSTCALCVAVLVPRPGRGLYGL